VAESNDLRRAQPGEPAVAEKTQSAQR